MRLFQWLLLPMAFVAASVHAVEPGETRCGAAGYIEQYRCFGTNCNWQNKYQRCANTNRAPACNVGDSKCGANGYVQRCTQYAADPFWLDSSERCAADRDPADNAPPGYGGYGQRPYGAGSGYGSAGDARGASEPRACSPGQQECGVDRRIRRCVMQGGRPAWDTVPGSRCGQSGFRN